MYQIMRVERNKAHLSLSVSVDRAIMYLNSPGQGGTIDLKQENAMSLLAIIEKALTDPYPGMMYCINFADGISAKQRIIVHLLPKPGGREIQTRFCLYQENKSGLLIDSPYQANINMGLRRSELEKFRNFLAEYFA